MFGNQARNGPLKVEKALENFPNVHLFANLLQGHEVGMQLFVSFLPAKESEESVEE